jgi:hypothetical protein
MGAFVCDFTDDRRPGAAPSCRSARSTRARGPGNRRYRQAVRGAPKCERETTVGNHRVGSSVVPRRSHRACDQRMNSAEETELGVQMQSALPWLARFRWLRLLRYSIAALGAAAFFGLYYLRLSGSNDSALWLILPLLLIIGATTAARVSMRSRCLNPETKRRLGLSCEAVLSPCYVISKDRMGVKLPAIGIIDGSAFRLFSVPAEICLLEVDLSGDSQVRVRLDRVLRGAFVSVEIPQSEVLRFHIPSKLTKILRSYEAPRDGGSPIFDRA